LVLQHPVPAMVVAGIRLFLAGFQSFGCHGMDENEGFLDPLNQSNLGTTSSRVSLTVGYSPATHLATSRADVVDCA
jgi:hypothetical protein